ncbi:MAG: hypothetical protein M1812_003566 [Candelaria pacifica]|nr:MAG: hypothetical protein M1812_003566 [Candelaria pacifica]
MLARSLLVLSIACLSQVLGTPAVLEDRAAQEQHPTTALYKKFLLFEQYAAAAFCPDNNKPPGGNLLKCGPGICPDVEKAKAKSSTQFQNSLKTDVTGYVAVDQTNKLITVFFRGSESIRNWVADITFVDTDTQLCDGCKAEKGFWESWEEAEKRDGITKAVKVAKDANKGMFLTLLIVEQKHKTNQGADYQIVVGGHSLGAAVATLAAASLRKAGNKLDLYTYGSPRVANEELRKWIEKNSDSSSAKPTPRQSNSNYRITHSDDLVPQLPPKITGLQHIGPEYWIKPSGNNQQVMQKLTEKDVFIFADGQNKSGNSGQKGDKSAHGWYFAHIVACYPQNDKVEFKA